MKRTKKTHDPCSRAYHYTQHIRDPRVRVLESLREPHGFDGIRQRRGKSVRSLQHWRQQLLQAARPRVCTERLGKTV